MRHCTTLLSALIALFPTSSATQGPNAEEQQVLISPDVTFEPVFTATDEVLGHEATEPVTTTARDGSETPEHHWTPERPDPYVCEYMGENNCWAPRFVEDGPPYSHSGEWPARSKMCVIPALNDPQGDDAPAILKAFEECREDGHVVFEDTTYYVGRVMNTTGLKDVDVDIRGKLLWSTDIQYWLKNSLPIGFQNQTAAWHLGGERLHVYGHDKGTLDGNGQAWYDFNQGVSNRHGRPHAVLITDTIDSVIEGLRFIKSQMWTMTVARSEKVLLQDIYVNNTSDGRKFRANVNTDGVDTAYANNITFLRWTIDNGDDSISMKQNSTNIYIANCTFHSGEAFAMGSIGQYPGQIEVIANVTAENIRFHHTRYAARLKTWTGIAKGVPPNGGGGGFGAVRNVTFRNFQLDNVEQALALTQCTSYNGMRGACWTSRIKVDGLYFEDVRGTVTRPDVATLQCSEAAPCEGMVVEGIQLTRAEDGSEVTGYRCANVVDGKGFECTGDCGPEGLACPH